jgi:trans-aconitate methyltransferase
MHEAVIDFVKQYATDEPVRVLDIGGRKTSTSGKYYSGPHPVDLFPNAEYHVMDVTPGPDVDIVTDATGAWMPAIPYDVVICTEVLEHVKDWPAVLVTAWWALSPGGRLILTCAGPGRRPHPATTEDLDPPPGEWYQNVGHLEVRDILINHAGFRDVLTWQVGQDTQATALR